MGKLTVHGARNAIRQFLHCLSMIVFFYAFYAFGAVKKKTFPRIISSHAISIAAIGLRIANYSVWAFYHRVLPRTKRKGNHCQDPNFRGYCRPFVIDRSIRSRVMPRTQHVGNSPMYSTTPRAFLRPAQDDRNRRWFMLRIMIMGLGYATWHLCWSWSRGYGWGRRGLVW
ncbi:hypothetical protein F4775DRAFT_435910 [Biscogniauxia sp. FL1348]|nr:hypothetical protein F4775DRAFT_435910 [Biscogniauxia sp. FL1348]